MNNNKKLLFQHFEIMASMITQDKYGFFHKLPKDIYYKPIYHFSHLRISLIMLWFHQIKAIIFIRSGYLLFLFIVFLISSLLKINIIISTFLFLIFFISIYFILGLLFKFEKQQEIQNILSQVATPLFQFLYVFLKLPKTEQALLLNKLPDKDIQKQIIRILNHFKKTRRIIIPQQESYLMGFTQELYLFYITRLMQTGFLIYIRLSEAEKIALIEKLPEQIKSFLSHIQTINAYSKPIRQKLLILIAPYFLSILFIKYAKKLALYEINNFNILKKYYILHSDIKLLFNFDISLEECALDQTKTEEMSYIIP